MKKLFLNPMSIVFMLFATILIGSNVCCTGIASNNDNSLTNEVVKTTSSQATAVPGGVINLTEQSFDAKISTGVTLVDFWATWCKPCRRQAPVIEEVSTEMAGKVNVGKLDIDESPLIADKYGVESIPTMIIFKDGIAVGQFIGLTSKEDIITALNKQLK
jgi:thioredoxin 1